MHQVHSTSPLVSIAAPTYSSRRMSALYHSCLFICMDIYVLAVRCCDGTREYQWQCYDLRTSVYKTAVAVVPQWYLVQDRATTAVRVFTCLLHPGPQVTCAKCSTSRTCGMLTPRRPASSIPLPVWLLDPSCLRCLVY